MLGHQLSTNLDLLQFREAEEQRLRSLFARFDVDCSGFLDREELRSAFHHFTGQPCSDFELDRLVAIASVDGAAQVDYASFARFCRTASFALEFGVQGRSRYLPLSVGTSGDQRERLAKFCAGAVAGSLSRLSLIHI